MAVAKSEVEVGEFAVVIAKSEVEVPFLCLAFGLKIYLQCDAGAERKWCSATVAGFAQPVLAGR